MDGRELLRATTAVVTSLLVLYLVLFGMRVTLAGTLPEFVTRVGNLAGGLLVGLAVAFLAFSAWNVLLGNS